MKRIALLVVSLLMACYQPQSIQGPPGERGPMGPPGPSVVWKNQVDTVIAVGDQPMYKDANGNWWPVETDFGQVDLRKLQTFNGWVAYVSTNCTGPSFYLGEMVGQYAYRQPFHPPRAPFFVASEKQWRVRADNARVQVIDLQSILNEDGSCMQRTDLAEPVIPTGPASSMVISPPPDLGSTGPLHKETYQD